eukprot:3370919-Pyramimonas_sp.AAC.1
MRTSLKQDNAMRLQSSAIVMQWHTAAQCNASQYTYMKSNVEQCKAIQSNANQQQAMQSHAKLRAGYAHACSCELMKGSALLGARER